MIYLGTKEITAFFLGRLPISAIYKGSQLLWQAVRSCFGAGYWVEDKPWLDDEAWKE